MSWMPRLGSRPSPTRTGRNPDLLPKRLLRQVDNTPQPGVRVAILPGLPEVIERRLASTVPRRDALDLVCVAQCGGNPCDFAIGGGGQVQPAEYAVHPRMNARSRRHDPLDAGMGAPGYHNKSSGCLERHRQLRKLLRPGTLRDQCDEVNARHDFQGRIHHDELTIQPRYAGGEWLAW